MSEDQSKNATSNTVISMVNATGLPTTLRGKAQRWLLRLIGGTVASPLVHKGRETWDQVEGRSKVNMMLAEEIGRQAIADPEIMERAKAHFLADMFKKQENLEEVAKAAVEELQKSHEESSAQPEDVDEDWMNLFSRHAEGASSERLRHLWGQILAGEIRSSGSFSPTTLRIASELDQATAQDFVRLSAYVFGDSLLKSDEWSKGDLFMLGTRLESAGLIIGGSSAFNRIYNAKASTVPIAVDGKLVLMISIPQDRDIQISAITLTKPGLQLIALQDRDARGAARMMALELKKHGATTAFIGIIEDQGNITPVELIFSDKSEF